LSNQRHVNTLLDDGLPHYSICITDARCLVWQWLMVLAGGLVEYNSLPIHNSKRSFGLVVRQYNRA
jgi:hypothetical protein